MEDRQVNRKIRVVGVIRNGRIIKVKGRIQTEK